MVLSSLIGRTLKLEDRNVALFRFTGNRGANDLNGILEDDGDVHQWVVIAELLLYFVFCPFRRFIDMTKLCENVLEEEKAPKIGTAGFRSHVLILLINILDLGVLFVGSNGVKLLDYHPNRSTRV